MSKKKISVIVVGYVGLTLAVEFAKKRPVVGFEIRQQRVDELNEGHDPTLEVEDDALQAVLIENNPKSDEKGLFQQQSLKI